MTTLLRDMTTSPLHLLGRQGEPHAGGLLWNVSLLSPWQRISRTGFCLVVLMVLTILTICAIDAVRLVGEPFPGFFVNERLVVTNFGRPDWTGPQNDLKFPDRLLEADGRRLTSLRDLKEVVRHTPVGQPIHYGVERGERRIEAVIPTMTFTWMDLVLTFGPTLSAGMLYLLIAVVVYVLKPDTVITWALVLSCFLMGTYQVLTFDIGSTHRFVRATLMVYALLPGAGLHLSLMFPERKALVDRWAIMQLAPYGASIALGAAALWLYPGPGFMAVYAWIRIYALVSIAAILLASLHAFVHSKSFLARQRAKVVLLGAVLAFPLPATINTMSFVGGTSATFQVLSTFVPFTLILFPASIGYAIARHNLFDVDVYLKRTVGYIMMTGCVAGGYFALQTIARTAVLEPLLGGAAEHVYPLVFALLTVFAFNPLSRAVQRAVDKVFYRAGADYKATVAAISEALSSLTELRTFITSVVEEIRHGMFVDRAGVVVLDPRQHTCEVLFFQDRGAENVSDASVKTPSVSLDDPLLSILARERRLITKYDIAEDPTYAPIREACGRRFAELGASLALPLFYREEFAGMLALGYKKSGHFYSRDDVELLQTLSSMASTAIEHSREKGQRAVLMQLFSKHVSPQVAEALWEQREQFLEGGRPRSQNLTVTAMFTDLEGFSTISERQDPDVLMKWLNTYMDMVTTTVMEHGGVVDDFFGDGVKINFGVPVPRTTEAGIARDAINAVSCALAMEDKMVRLNESMADQGYQPLRMRVGIYTGWVVAGSLGSADRMKYTTLGDTVNTAARLESYSKEIDIPEIQSRPCRILIGESTRRHLGERFRLRAVGDMELKGKTATVTAYCVLGRNVESGQPASR